MKVWIDGRVVDGTDAMIMVARTQGLGTVENHRKPCSLGKCQDTFIVHRHTIHLDRNDGPGALGKAGADTVERHVIGIRVALAQRVAGAVRVAIAPLVIVQGVVLVEQRATGGSDESSE